MELDEQQEEEFDLPIDDTINTIIKTIFTESILHQYYFHCINTILYKQEQGIWQEVKSIHADLSLNIKNMLTIVMSHLMSLP